MKKKDKTLLYITIGFLACIIAIVSVSLFRNWRQETNGGWDHQHEVDSITNLYLHVRESRDSMIQDLLQYKDANETLERQKKYYVRKYNKEYNNYKEITDDKELDSVLNADIDTFLLQSFDSTGEHTN